jgi:hypothetical protein
MNWEKTPVDWPKLLEEIENELKHPFSRVMAGELNTPTTFDAPKPKTISAVTEGGWTVLVVKYAVLDVDSPPNTFGYDGTAARRGAIVHLSRGQAEKFFKKAMERVDDENEKP